MLTDSRSLSYTRHEYFRRILCGQMERGILPADSELVGPVVTLKLLATRRTTSVLA